MQASFSELEYAAKKKPPRRDRFLVEIDAVMPWVELERAVMPFCPSRGGRGGRRLDWHECFECTLRSNTFVISDEGVEDVIYPGPLLSVFDNLEIMGHFCRFAPDN